MINQRLLEENAEEAPPGSVPSPGREYWERFLFRDTPPAPAPAAAQRPAVAPAPEARRVTVEDRRIAQRAPSAYMPWTPEEDAALSEAYRSGTRIHQLAGKHRRTKGAIKARLRKLGLLH